MPNLTNAQLAKAMGWKRVKDATGETWKSPDDKVWSPFCPKFTTSLDAIVGAIEGEGLVWGLFKTNIGSYCGRVGKILHLFEGKNFESMTAPLALAQAFYSYLKGKK